MARSHYYSKQKLNEYFQKNVKDRTEKYYNFTYQKLSEEEDVLKKKIKKEFERIKISEQSIKETREIGTGLNEKRRTVENEIIKEESEQRDKAKINGISPPLRPDNDTIINARNVICFLLAGFTGYAVSQDIAEGIAFILFIPAFFFLFKVIAYWVLKAEDQRELDRYYEEYKKYNQIIDNKFIPSAKYQKNKKTLEKINHLSVEAKDITNNDYKIIKAKKFEILILKKILFEFKRLKKRASDRERTAKINAFEKKNRSGSQNIKDKLLKAVRVKSNWSCPYCTNLSNINSAEADHIHPVNKGGLTTIQNMVLICKKCNSKKTNLMLRVFCKKQGFEYSEVCDQLEKLGKDV